jgi:hypothetical protein
VLARASVDSSPRYSALPFDAELAVHEDPCYFGSHVLDSEFLIACKSLQDKAGPFLSHRIKRLSFSSLN